MKSRGKFRIEARHLLVIRVLQLFKVDVYAFKLVGNEPIYKLTDHRRPKCFRIQERRYRLLVRCPLLHIIEHWVDKNPILFGDVHDIVCSGILYIKIG